MAVGCSSAPPLPVDPVPARNDNSSGSSGGGGFGAEPVGTPGTPERSYGSAFFIDVDGATWAVTAFHLEETFGGPPTRIFAGGVWIGLGAPLPAANDVRFLPVTDGRATMLPLSDDTVRDGDPLLILSPRGDVQGQYQGPSYTAGTRSADSLLFVPSAAFAADGYSGSPVLIPSTGEVVGMVVAADVPGVATRLGFVPVIPPRR